MTHVHMSLRHDHPDPAVDGYVEATLLTHQPRSLSTTESGGFRHELSVPGYVTVHDRGHEGEAECATLVRRDAFVRALSAVRLSPLPIPRRGGWRVWAARAVTVDGQMLAVHMPSGVEGAEGFRRSTTAAKRVEVYRDAIGGLRRYVANHPQVTEIWGDWNLDARLSWVRDYFATHFPGFKIAAPSEATHRGGRVIDWGLVRKGQQWTATAEPNPVSEHATVIATRQEAPVGHLPRNLPALLRARGLRVVEVDGWYGRGRPASTGGFDPVGVLCHHTATSRSSSDDAVLRLLTHGRSDLPGPLCQIGLGRDGTVYLIASGRANHAGRAKASGSVAAGDGNELYVGIEAFNDGRGEPWPAEQYDAYVTLAAALCADVTGNSVRTVRAHKETSLTGKIDPRFDMGDFRDRAAVRLDAFTDARIAHTPNPEDWFTMATKEDLDKALADSWHEDDVIPAPKHWPKDNPGTSPASAIGYAWQNSIDARADARAAVAGITALAEALEAIAPDVAQKVSEAVRQSLAEGLELTVSTKEEQA